jgi:hypothetical protein
VAACPLVRIDAEQPSDVIQQEQQITVKLVQGRILTFKLIISGVII